MVSRDVKVLEENSWSDQENELVDNQIPSLEIDEQLENTWHWDLRFPILQVKKQQ